MGNRAVITTKENWQHGGIGIYLHWNGGRDSVEGFLEYCRLKGFRDGSYGLARLTQVIANFFGGGLSIGIDTLWHLDCDNGDNGVYIIDNWEIVDRCFMGGAEQQEYELQDMLLSIDEAQPEGERITDYIKAKEVNIADIKVGDTACFIDDLDGKVVKEEVVGIGEEGRIVNGTDVSVIPYIARYSMANPDSNINNYLRKDVKIIPAE